jgi:predicted DNA-binding mobile mystery protein A
MATRLQQLQTAQTDAALGAWREAKLPARPATGWAKSIREALGLPGIVLAKRLGITSATLRNLEAAEARQAITLASLHKLAQAMDCELQYALVPRQSLSQQIAQQAQKKAQEQLGPIAHTMALEDQAVQGSARQLQRDLLAQELLHGSRHKLWAEA